MRPGKLQTAKRKSEPLGAMVRSRHSDGVTKMGISPSETMEDLASNFVAEKRGLKTSNIGSTHQIRI